MKKRLLSSVLAILLLVCAAGCQTAEKNQASNAPPPASPSISPQDTAPPPVDMGAEKAAALEAYTRVADRLSISPESGGDVQFDMDIMMKTDVEFAGETESIETSGNIKIKIVGGEMQSSLVLDMGEAGQMEMYSDGEKAYCSINGQELEIETGSVFGQVEQSLNIPQFEKDAIKSYEIKEDGENTKIHLVIDGAELKSFITESLTSLLGETGDAQKLEIYDIEISLVMTKDEIPLSMEMKMGLEMTVLENKIKMMSDAIYTFNKFDSGVNVDLSKL